MLQWIYCHLQCLFNPCDKTLHVSLSHSRSNYISRWSVIYYGTYSWNGQLSNRYWLIIRRWRKRQICPGRSWYTEDNKAASMSPARVYLTPRSSAPTWSGRTTSLNTDHKRDSKYSYMHCSCPVSETDCCHFSEKFMGKLLWQVVDLLRGDDRIRERLCTLNEVNGPGQVQVIPPCCNSPFSNFIDLWADPGPQNLLGPHAINIQQAFRAKLEPARFEAVLRAMSSSWIVTYSLIGSHATSRPSVFNHSRQNCSLTHSSRWW